MTSQPSQGFAVDLQHLDDVTSRIRGFTQFVTERLEELDRRAQAVGAAWTGRAGSSYTDAHREWLAGATDVRDGMHTLEEAARRAHQSYSDAVAVNVRMLG
jgi:WXG100 family type VII secretion target